LLEAPDKGYIFALKGEGKERKIIRKGEVHE